VTKYTSPLGIATPLYELRRKVEPLRPLGFAAGAVVGVAGLGALAFVGVVAAGALVPSLVVVSLSASASITTLSLVFSEPKNANAATRRITAARAKRPN